jgi:hypothetical protein
MSRHQDFRQKHLAECNHHSTEFILSEATALMTLIPLCGTKGGKVCVTASRPCRGYPNRFVRFSGFIALLAIALLSPAHASTSSQSSGRNVSGLSQSAAQSGAAKLGQIIDASPGHGFGSVRISEPEANSYLYYEMASEFPPGVSKPHLKFSAGRMQGTVEVDFDRLKQGMRTPPSPLVAYFLAGIHTVGVEGPFSATNGMAQFHLETVTLDDVVMPQMLVDYLIDHYLKSRYPGLAVDRPFSLAPSVDRVVVESGDVLVTSKP